MECRREKEKEDEKTYLPERLKHVLVGRVVVRSEELLECLSRFPRVVVRDLRRDVVGDVGLGDTCEVVVVNTSQRRG